jgi:hypothetical protein
VECHNVEITVEIVEDGACAVADGVVEEGGVEVLEDRNVDMSQRITIATWDYTVHVCTRQHLWLLVLKPATSGAAERYASNAQA